MSENWIGSENVKSVRPLFACIKLLILILESEENKKDRKFTIFCTIISFLLK